MTRICTTLLVRYVSGIQARCHFRVYGLGIDGVSADDVTWKIFPDNVCHFYKANT